MMGDRRRVWSSDSVAHEFRRGGGSCPGRSTSRMSNVRVTYSAMCHGMGHGVSVNINLNTVYDGRVGLSRQ